MPAHQAGINIILHVGIGVINKGRKDNRRHHKEENLQNTSVALFCMRAVFLDFLMNSSAVYPVDKYHKQQSHQNSGSRTHRSAHRSQNGFGSTVRGKRGDQQITCQNADNRVGDLLQNLGHRSGNHRIVRLKISPQNTQDRGEKDGRRKYPQRRKRILLVIGKQIFSSEKSQQRRQRTDRRCVDQRTVKHSLGVSVLLQRQPFRNNLGDSHRYAVGGDQKKDDVDIACRSIISQTFAADRRPQRASVQKADYPGDDRSDHQDGRVSQQ